jgi:hypothetical protein
VHKVNAKRFYGTEGVWLSVHTSEEEVRRNNTIFLERMFPFPWIALLHAYSASTRKENTWLKRFKLEARESSVRSSIRQKLLADENLSYLKVQ